MLDPSITLVSYQSPEDYKLATTEFIVFAEPIVQPLVYSALLQVYKDRPQFRKLSMVAPVSSTPLSMIYGWTIEDGWVSPKYEPSSREPYAIQVGSVLDSVIRKSALDKIDYLFTGSRLADSAGISVALWESGQRCYLDPDTIARADNRVDMALDTHLGPSTIKLFKREMIG